MVELNTILGSTWSGDTGDYSGEVELHVFGITWLNARVVPQALSPAICLDQGDLIRRAPGQRQVIQGHLIHGENRRCRPKLRTHVANGRTVRQGNLGDTSPIKFHKLPDHSMLAEHLSNGEHDVSSGDSRGDGTAQLETNDPRNEHRYWLTEHRGFCLNTAHTPSQDTKSIDHGCVGVGADTGVGESLSEPVDVLGVGHLCKVFDVDLVDNSGARRYHLEVVERRLAPPQELVPLTVALIFNVDIALK